VSAARSIPRIGTLSKAPQVAYQDLWENVAKAKGEHLVNYARPAITLAVALATATAASSSPPAAVAPLSWGDQGDGTYRNPVLSADFSDPDVIRVGDDFYLIASDFHFVGIQVLHSRDLVNWRIVGQVFDRLTMSPKYDAMQGYAQGTWAPSLRHHDGTFYLYVCTPYDGLFLWKAKRPEGPWSQTITVKAVEGWEDPAPFWDDDGTPYLIHSRKGAGPLIVHKMSADGTQLLDDGVEIYRGPVAEGPKLFKRHGWYYVSLPEGGVEKGGQTVLRSRALYGPYERRQVLPDGSPHQGGIVDLASGESWFIGFKSSGHLGRVSHLMPVRWGDDDWPVFGDEGHTVEQWRKPAVGASGPIFHPQTSDDFEAAALPPQWQWNHNPVVGAWSLSERRGWLRLRPQPAPELTLARDTLTQKLWGPRGTVDVTLDARGLADGQRAGFAFMSGKVFSPIGVVRERGGLRLYWEGGEGPVLRKRSVRLRGVYDGDAARLSYSIDNGTTWVDSGTATTLKFGQWKGARVALYAYGEGKGVADFDLFQYRHGTAGPKP
jgi:beta-xylosidase